MIQRFLALISLFIFFFFGGIFLVLAEGEEGSGGNGEVYGISVSSCEVEMIKAFDIARTEFYTSYNEFLELPSVTAVAKSNPENLNFYRTRYECNIDMICEAIRNPYPNYTLSSEEKIYNCAGGEERMTAKKYTQQLGVDFSSCATPSQPDLQMTVLGEYWKRCEALKKHQMNQFKVHLATSFIENSQKENQSILATKILEMRKRMEVLVDKTRIFSIAFLKTNDDLHCTLPSRSGE